MIFPIVSKMCCVFQQNGILFHSSEWKSTFCYYMNYGVTDCLFNNVQQLTPNCYSKLDKFTSNWNECKSLRYKRLPKPLSPQSFVVIISTKRNLSQVNCLVGVWKMPYKLPRAMDQTRHCFISSWYSFKARHIRFPAFSFVSWKVEVIRKYPSILFIHKII